MKCLRTSITPPDRTQITHNLTHAVLWITAVLGLALATPALAAEKYWAGGNDWWDFNNWSATFGGVTDGSGQPLDGDNVYLYNSGASNTTVNYTNTLYPTATLNSLSVNATGSGAMTLSQTRDNLQTLSEIVGDTGTGAVNQTGGTHRVTNDLILGNSATGEGNFTVSNSATLSSQNLLLGNFGTGTLNIENGGAVVTSDFGLVLVGYAAGSTGTITVDGAGSTLTLGSGFIRVGGSGTATLNILNGGAVYTGEGSIDGTVTVDGPDSYWENWNNLYVGDNTSGTLNILNGGVVSGAGYESFLGYDAGSTGAITVDGAGSAFNSEAISVGGSGTGTLNIQNGGTSSSWDYLNIRNAGTVTVNGAGSTLSTGHTYINGSDASSLNILNGGSVISGSNQLGFTAGSTGTATIDGPGSTWTSGEIYVGGNSNGAGGSGTVNVQNGGTVDVGGTLQLYEGGTANIAGGNVTTAFLVSEGTIGGHSGLVDVSEEMTFTDTSISVFDLGGVQRGDEYLAFDVGGTLTLGGELNLSLFDSGSGLFTPALGDTFDLFTAETIMGEFDFLTFALLGDDLYWKVNYLFDATGTTDILRLSVASAAVPVPPTMWLMVSGLTGLVAVARRKRNLS